VLAQASKDAAVTLIATGSEVALALAARNMLEAERIPTTVVSMPCWELFEAQDAGYRNAVIDPRTVRVSVEAGATLGWSRYVGETGVSIGLDGFGASAPYEELYAHFGITAEAVAAAARARLLAASKDGGATGGEPSG
jgi:transketolase